MSVDIDIDLKAAGAQGKIGAIAASLKGLEQVADDIDIDFDADVGEITEELEKFSEALNSLDTDISNVGSELKEAARELDGAEMSVVAEAPDGSTGSGDSTGGDPPDSLVTDLTSFGKDVDTSAGSATDGGSRASIFERVNGPDAIHMSDDDLGELLKTRSGGGLSNLGGSSPLIPEYDAISRTARRGSYGLEPDSMAYRRANVLSNERADRIDFELQGTDSVRQELSIREERGLLGDPPSRDKGRSGFLPKIDSRFGKVDSTSDAVRKLDKNNKKLGSTLRRLKPSMSKYREIIAAILPVALALGTQLLGVAAAMGSVAAAGGAIMALGLFGHGNTMASSAAKAKREMRDLKKEMYQVAQPTLQEFAPIQARMFDSIPDGLDGVFEEMEGLTSYEDTLFSLGGSLAGGMEEAVAIVNENEQAISQLSRRFGGLIGSGLLDFFEWLIQAAARNQNLLVSLGSDMMKLAVVAYNLSMAIAKIVTAFSPLFDFLVWISELLNGAVLVGLIAAVGYLFLLGKAAMTVYGLATAFSALTTWVTAAEGGMIGYMASTWGAVAATLALVAAVGALTLGSSLLVGGAVTAGAMGSSDTPDGPNSPGGSGGYGGGGKTVYNDNRSFTINSGGSDDYATQKSVEDTVQRVSDTNEAQSLPPIGNNS